MTSRQFAIAVFCDAVAMLGVEMGTPYLPVLLSEMGVENAAALIRWTGLAQGACFLVGLFAIPLWGRWGDRAGRKATLLRAHAGLGLSLFLLARAGSPTGVIAAKALQGLLGGIAAATLALVSARKGASRRIGWLQSATMAGALAGPLTGAFLLSRGGASGLYETGAALVMGSGLLLAILVEESSIPRKTSEAKAGRGLPVLLGGTGALAAWVFAWRSLEDPLIAVFVREIVPEKAAWTFWTGIVLTASRAGSLVSAPLWGRWAERRGSRAALRGSLIGAALFTSLQALAAGPLMLAGLRSVLGLFLGGLRPALYSDALSRSHPASSGETVGLVSSGSRLGNFIGSASSGLLAGAFGIPGLLALAGAGVGLTLPILSRQAKRPEA